MTQNKGVVLKLDEVNLGEVHAYRGDFLERKLQEQFHQAVREEAGADYLVVLDRRGRDIGFMHGGEYETDRVLVSVRAYDRGSVCLQDFQSKAVASHYADRVVKVLDLSQPFEWAALNFDRDGFVIACESLDLEARIA